MDGEPKPALHTNIYNELRRRLITGKIFPGVSLSTRRLAMEMGVSQMPVRDALSRLAAEGAIRIRAQRSIEVAGMTENRFSDLLECRLLLEPEAAVAALPHITRAKLRRLKEIDRRLDEAIERGDVIGYMECNFHFHFGIYQANDRPALNRLIEAVWLQFGPFMRVVYGRFGTSNLVDQHVIALQSIEANDANALRNAISSDIRDGMTLIGHDLWPSEEPDS
jgi:DNA-binding GntR family transcriptional regulator